MGFWYSKQKLVPPFAPWILDSSKCIAVRPLVDFNKAEECYNQISIERKDHPANNMPVGKWLPFNAELT